MGYRLASLTTNFFTLKPLDRCAAWYTAPSAAASSVLMLLPRSSLWNKSRPVRESSLLYLEVNSLRSACVGIKRDPSMSPWGSGHTLEHEVKSQWAPCEWLLHKTNVVGPQTFTPMGIKRQRSKPKDLLWFSKVRWSSPKEDIYIWTLKAVRNFNAVCGVCQHDSFKGQKLLYSRRKLIAQVMQVHCKHQISYQIHATFLFCKTKLVLQIRASEILVSENQTIHPAKQNSLVPHWHKHTTRTFRQRKSSAPPIITWYHHVTEGGQPRGGWWWLGRGILHNDNTDVTPFVVLGLKMKSNHV